MRLATYNVENLFDRAKVLNLRTWDQGRVVLDNFAKLNALLNKQPYSAADKTKIRDLVRALGMAKSDTGPFVLLRQNKGKLLVRRKSGAIDVVATGRAAWAGDLELRDEPVNDAAMRNTARVLSDVKANVMCIVEAESRPVLATFNGTIIKAIKGTPFNQVMLIDGNDERGIDVGCMTRQQFEMLSIRSHVDDRVKGEFVFSRDCPEITIETKAGNRLIVLVNHFKSKGFGGIAASNARRKLQAQQVRKIYQRLVKEGEKFVAIAGDLNDTPDSAPLRPLFQGTGLKDVFQHPKFDNGGYPGTFRLCNKNDKLDYILLSPALWKRVEKGGVWRKGMWPGVKPKRWPCYPTVTKEVEAGSDHAAVWVDVDV